MNILAMDTYMEDIYPTMSVNLNYFWWTVQVNLVRLTCFFCHFRLNASSVISRLCRSWSRLALFLGSAGFGFLHDLRVKNCLSLRPWLDSSLNSAGSPLLCMTNSMDGKLWTNCLLCVYGPNLLRLDLNRWRLMNRQSNMVFTPPYEKVILQPYPYHRLYWLVPDFGMAHPWSESTLIDRVRFDSR